MVKLVEKLAKELPGWPSEAKYMRQDVGGNIYAYDEAGRCFLVMRCDEMTDDGERARVTRAMYEAEKVREIAATGAMTSEEQELADIACGKRSREDQDLWDKVAIAAMQGLLSAGATYGGVTTNRDKLALDAFAHADAFMAERAKRMNGGA